jgi:hypothetical protein
VRGLLKLLKEKCLCENTDISILDYVSGCKHTFIKACEIAHENIKQSQIKMKQWYDKDGRIIEFEHGEKVPVILPVSGHPLLATHFRPNIIESLLNFRVVLREHSCLKHKPCRVEGTLLSDTQAVSC